MIEVDARGCQVTDEALLEYVENAAGMGQSHVLARHVRACPYCHQRIREFGAIDDLLDAAVPAVSPLEVQAQKSVFMERLADRGTADKQPLPASKRWWQSHWRPCLAALIVVVLLAVFIVPEDTVAEFPLARVLGFTRDDADRSGPSVIREQHRPTATTVDASIDNAQAFNPVILHTLPGGFELVSTRIVSHEHIVLEYERSDGLILIIDEVLAAGTQTTIPRGLYELERVDDTDVLLLFNSEWESVSQLIWQRGDIIFNIFVETETNAKNLTLTLARDLVIALNGAIGQ